MPGRRAKVTPIVDPSQAMRGLATIQGGLSKFTGSLAGVGKGRSNPWGGLASAVSNSGLANEFSMVTGGLVGISDGLDRVYDKSKRKINIGATLTGAGVIGASLGGVAEQLASPLEAARAQLNQSIRNVGGDASKLDQPISATEHKMQSLGFVFSDTDSSLSKLVPVLGSGKKAIAEEGLVADIAARNHVDLASATDVVIKAYGKSPMALRAFGINLSDTTAKGKAAVSAQKAHGKAQDDLSKARQRLAQLEGRLGASASAQDSKTAKQRQSNAAAVGAAQDELAAAGQHLQDVEAKLREGHTSAASAQAQLESAQNRVAAASKRLTDAEGKGVTVAGLSVSQQQELANAHGAVDDAQKKATLTGYVAATTAGDLNKANLTGQQILDLLTKKTKGLAQAQAQTFGGDLRKWKAQVIDWGATFGEHFAKPLITIGPALAGLGAIIQTGFFGKVGGGLATLTRGVGSLGRSVLGATGIVSKAPSAGAGAAAAASGAAAEQTSAGELDGSAAQLDTAAAELRSAAAELARSALQLQGAATDEAGAATSLDGSATSLEGSGTALDGSATGLDASGTALDASGTALDASGTALDASATALDGAAAANGAKGAVGGAGGGALGKAALVGTAGLLAYQGTSAVLKHNLFGAGTGVKHVLGALGIGAAPVTKAGIAKNIVGGQATLDALAKKDPRAAAILKGLPRAAAGALVLARPGGTPLIAGEAGQDEIIGSPATIVAALEKALGVHGGGTAPNVAHYHQTVSMPNARIYAANLNDLIRQMEAQARRANFAGHGPAGGSDF